jgi:hypothetical protein
VADLLQRREEFRRERATTAWHLRQRQPFRWRRRQRAWGDR